MALTLSKTNITTGNIINASDITQIVDAFTKQEAYDITLSGSFQMTGSHSSLNGYTGSLLGTSSFAINAGSTDTFRGLFKISGSPAPIVNPQIQVSIGASQTGNTPPYQAVVDVGAAKILGQSSFITATPYSGSIAANPGIWVVSQVGQIVIFETQLPSINFNYQVMYI
jgi:hypothetical protein